MGAGQATAGRATVSGWLAVAAAILTLAPAALPAQETGVRRALLIGVGDYAVNDRGRDDAGDVLMLADLEGPVNDVVRLSRVLTTRFGYRAEDIVTLVDGQADRAAILDALNGLVEATGPLDVVYVHFSGLGSRVPDSSGDERDGWDDTILPHDARMPGVADISDDELDAILGRLRARSALVVLDAGHDPMPVSAGSNVRVRAAGQDGRTELYEGTAAGEQRTAEAQEQGGGYVLISAAAAGQFALESRIDGGPPLGWFSWALARTLGTAERQTSVRDVFERTQQAIDNLGIRAGLWAPAARLAGDGPLLSRAILDGDQDFAESDGASTRTWIDVLPEGGGKVRLDQGALFDGARGSVWALFPPGTTDFTLTPTLATAEVDRVQGLDAAATLDGGGSVPLGSRAVLLAPAPPAEAVTVWVRSAEPGGGKALEAALEAAAGSPVEFVDSAEGARFIVTLDNRGYRMFAPGGLQELARFGPGDGDAIGSMAVLIDRSARLRRLQALDNPSAGLWVRLSVSPIDVDGMPRVTAVSGARPIPTFRVRTPGEARAPDNSLMMRISVDRPAYITVVDIGPEGGISPMFPNPVSDEHSFYPEGLVPGGTEIRIPDSLVAGTAGFYIDYEPPGGPDTLRVFATADPVTAQRIREHLARLVAAADSTIPPQNFTEIFLPLDTAPAAEVGTAASGFGASSVLGQDVPQNFVDWAATSVSFRVQE